MRAKAAADGLAAQPPLRRSAPTLVPSDVQAAAPARKVLLVEDDPDLLNLLTAAFVREGFETHCASNGRLGIEMLQTLKPDLMVTDIVMPEMEGIAAIIEARRASPDTRVIAISGGGHYGKSRNFLAWAHELGADEVLAKPFRMSSLITAARVVLSRAIAPVPANETTPRTAEIRAALGLPSHR
jgi:DNA-binding response OmpR family regulator